MFPPNWGCSCSSWAAHTLPPDPFLPSSPLPLPPTTLSLLQIPHFKANPPLLLLVPLFEATRRRGDPPILFVFPFPQPGAFWVPPGPPNPEWVPRGLKRTLYPFTRPTTNPFPSRGCLTHPPGRRSLSAGCPSGCSRCTSTSSSAGSSRR